MDSGGVYGVSERPCMCVCVCGWGCRLGEGVVEGWRRVVVARLSPLQPSTPPPGSLHQLLDEKGADNGA